MADRDGSADVLPPQKTRRRAKNAKSNSPLDTHFKRVLFEAKTTGTFTKLALGKSRKYKANETIANFARQVIDSPNTAKATPTRDGDLNIQSFGVSTRASGRNVPGPRGGQLHDLLDESKYSFTIDHLANAALIPIEKRRTFADGIMLQILETLTGLCITIPVGYSFSECVPICIIALQHPWASRPTYRYDVLKFFEQKYGDIAQIKPIPLSLIRQIDGGLYDSLYAAKKKGFPDYLVHDTFDPKHAANHPGRSKIRNLDPSPY